MNIKDCIQGNVTFLYYQGGLLHYKCENDFVFSVPTEDTGNGKFEAVGKGIQFMRWIRKAIEERT